MSNDTNANASKQVCDGPAVDRLLSEEQHALVHH